jgi:hypothetical protein
MNKPSRRAVVRTGVWAVPVVATATVAPAFANGSICTNCVTITGLAAGCKLPGVPRGKAYALVFNVTNTGPAQTLTINTLMVSGTGLVAECPATFDVPTGDSQIVVYVTDGINSQQKNATGTINYDGGG